MVLAVLGQQVLADPTEGEVPVVKALEVGLSCDETLPCRDTGGGESGSGEDGSVWEPLPLTHCHSRSARPAGRSSQTPLPTPSDHPVQCPILSRRQLRKRQSHAPGSSSWLAHSPAQELWLHGEVPGEAPLCTGIVGAPAWPPRCTWAERPGWGLMRSEAGPLGAQRC